MRNPDKQIAKAKKIYGNKYDYSKAIDAATTTELTTFICPLHGEFQTTWDRHLSKKSGCPMCNPQTHRNTRYTTEEWIKAAQAVHGDRYDYSSADYQTATVKVDVICHEKDIFGNEHGTFSVLPSVHLKGVGCPKCSHRFGYTTEEFIAKAKLIHKDRYDYSKTVYVNKNTKVIITCPIHGDFEQAPLSHLSGCGCSKCNNGVGYDTDRFLQLARQCHKGRYDYSKVVYINAKTPVIITCPIHGDFEQAPTLHIHGAGCPKCKASVMETTLINVFNKQHIPYIYQYCLPHGKYNLKADFYLPRHNIIIECQGEQHFTPTHFASSVTTEQAQQQYQKTLQYDCDKYDICQENGFDVLYYVNTPRFNYRDKIKETSFYNGKKVYHKIKDILAYIKANTTPIDNVTLFQTFVDDVINEVSNKFVVNDGNVLTFDDKVIIFHDKAPKGRACLNDKRCSYTKRGKKVLIIFFDEYYQHREIVLSKIKHICFPNHLPAIHGRKCSVQPISKTEATNFLQQNHIQGGVNATIYLGAFYQDKLIGVMQFLQEDSKGSWNLNRFASDINFQSVGVGGKLFKYFIRNYHYTTIKSFADKRWTVNKELNIYTKLGFVLDGAVFPDYRYIAIRNDSNMERLHKFRFRKQKLIKRYPDILDETMTEREMASLLGFEPIWDCGLLRYVYQNPNIDTLSND